MIRRTLPLLAAVACAAPETPSGDEAVYWIDTAAPEAGCPAPDISHNFTIGVIKGTAGGLTVSREELASTSGHYALVTRNEQGRVWVSYLGDVLVGEALADGSIEVGWTNEESFDEMLEEAAYRHTRSEQRTIDRVLTLGPSGESDVTTGTLLHSESRVLDLTESDQWDPELGGPTSTQMIESGDFLERPGSFVDVRNTSDEVDCVEGICELQVTSACTTELAVSAYRLADGDVELFEALEGYTRPEGLQ